MAGVAAEGQWLEVEVEEEVDDDCWRHINSCKAQEFDWNGQVEDLAPAFSLRVDPVETSVGCRGFENYYSVRPERNFHFAAYLIYWLYALVWPGRI